MDGSTPLSRPSCIPSFSSPSSSAIRPATIVTMKPCNNATTRSSSFLAFTLGLHFLFLQPIFQPGRFQAASARRGNRFQMNILVIAPHPDDETLGCGGTLCLHARGGGRVTAVFLTSGELGLKQLPRREAHLVRERETVRAASILGLAQLHFLRCADWGLNDEIDKTGCKLCSV